MRDLFPHHESTITNAMKIAKLERELSMRRRVYGARILAGKMKLEVADRQIKVLEAILYDYRRGGP